MESMILGPQIDIDVNMKDRKWEEERESKELLFSLVNRVASQIKKGKNNLLQLAYTPYLIT